MNSDLLLRLWLYCWGMLIPRPSYSVIKRGFSEDLYYGLRVQVNLLWVMLFRFYAVGGFWFSSFSKFTIVTVGICYGCYMCNGIFCSVGFLLVPWAFTFILRGVSFFSLCNRVFFYIWAC